MVELCGMEIGRVERSFGNCALTRFEGAGFMVEGQTIGLSLYISTGEASLKLVPMRPGTLDVGVGEELRIEFSRERDR